jgi:hypothetical protein
VLHDLIHIIVLVLLEPGVANLPEGGQLIRALNVLTVKIVERSEHTAVSLALLRLLQVSVYFFYYTGTQGTETNCRIKDSFFVIET